MTTRRPPDAFGCAAVAGRLVRLLFAWCVLAGASACSSGDPQPGTSPGAGGARTGGAGGSPATGGLAANGGAPRNGGGGGSIVGSDAMDPMEASPNTSDAGPDAPDLGNGSDSSAVPDSGQADLPDAGGEAGPMQLTSTAFKEGEDVPAKFRCGPVNVSPELAWTPGPPGTKSYAVTMLHQRSVHWVLWDIPATTLSLPEGIMRVAEPPVPPGSKQIKPNIDGFTMFGYTGPCPQSANRTYDFFVYALNVASLPGITTASSGQAANAAVIDRRYMIGMAKLTGTGSR